MFGKNKKVVFNPYDDRYETMWLDLQEKSTVLANRVRTSYVRNACIDVYPDGSDKEKAIVDSKDAKRSLLCAIGSYDTAKMELQNFYKENKEKLEKCSNWNPERFSNSHKLIEIYVENLIKRA